MEIPCDIGIHIGYLLWHSLNVFSLTHVQLWSWLDIEILVQLVYATIFHLCNRLDNLWYWVTQTSLDLFGDAVNTEISGAGSYLLAER